MIRLALYLLASVAVRVASAAMRRWAPAVDDGPDAPPVTYDVRLHGERYPQEAP